MHFQHLRRPALCCILPLMLFYPGKVHLHGQTISAPSQDNFKSAADSATTARRAGKSEEAMQNYATAVTIRPDWTEGWWYLGTMQYDADRYPQAILSFQKVVQLDPDLASAWSFLGLSEFETKDYANSLLHLEKAYSLGAGDDPDLMRVSNYHLALLLNQSAEFDRAATLLFATFGKSQWTTQATTALGISLLHIPLLPSDINPAHDGLLQAAGEAASTAQNSSAKASQALSALIAAYPATPYLHYVYGLALSSAGQMNAALDQQQKEIAISPQSALPHIQISAIELVLHHPQQALRAAKEAVNIAPHSTLAHQALSKALEATGMHQQAIEEAQTATSLGSQNQSPNEEVASFYSTRSMPNVDTATQTSDDAANWNQAMQDYSQRRFTETIASLNLWIEHKPNDGTAWAVMGLSEFELRNYNNALIHLERGRRLGINANSQSVQLASYRLAILLSRKGQFDAAIGILTPLIGEPPLASEIEFALGLALLRIPRLPEEIDPSQHALLQSSGEIATLLLLSRYDQAFPKIKTLLAQHPSTPFLHYAYGTALESLSQYEEASAEMRAEIRISPRTALPWIRLASIALRQHQPANALHPAQTAVELAPESADAHYVLGRTWVESGDPSKAIAELEKAVSITPESPEIHFALARAYAKSNQQEKAEEERASFARLNTVAEEQRAHTGSQSYQGAHDAVNPSVLGAAPAPQP